MKKQDVRIAILRVPGTNRDYDLSLVFNYLGASAEVIRTNQLYSGEKKLENYQAIIFPGGFAYGDHVRSGAIWAKQLLHRQAKEIKEFYNEGKFLLGICNGMQVLVETGFIPGINGPSPNPQACMHANAVGHFLCTWVNLKNVNKRRCPYSRGMSEQNELNGSNGLIPAVVAHGEGNFTISPQRLKHLQENDQIVFQYVKQDGEPAQGAFPFNPNGAMGDVAGVCNEEGNVLALMPHLENAVFWWQQPNWTKNPAKREEAPGIKLFKNLISEIERKF